MRSSSYLVAGLGAGFVAIGLLIAAVMADPVDPTPSTTDVASTVGDSAAGESSIIEGTRGLVVRPVLTSGGVTFVVPRLSSFWVSLHTQCYLAVDELFDHQRDSASPTLLGAFSIAHPWIPEALRDLDFVPGEDLFEAGTYGIGDGGVVIVLAVTLRRPERLGKFFQTFMQSESAPDSHTNYRFETISPLHHRVTFDTPKGPRLTEMHAVPVDWSEFPSGQKVSSWAKAAMKATHVAFMYTGAGIGDTFVIDLAPSKDALKAVQELESFLGDASDRCLVGVVNEVPGPVAGLSITRLRFAIAIPPATNDIAATLLGLTISPTLALRVGLRPMPSLAEVEIWLAALTQTVDGYVSTYAAAFPGAEQMQLGRLLHDVTEYRMSGSELEITASTRNITLDELVATGEERSLKSKKKKPKKRKRTSKKKKKKKGTTRQRK